MTLILLIVVGVLLAMWLAVLVLSRQSGLARVAASILALGLAAFCGFGFLASFELPASQGWPWQLAYAVAGVGSLITALFGSTAGWNRIKITERAK